MARTATRQADTFLRSVRELLHSGDDDDPDDDYLFRGQSDPGKPLIPTAWRAPTRRRLRSEYLPAAEPRWERLINSVYDMIPGDEVRVNWVRQFAIEYQLVRDFVDRADHLGHLVPEAEQAINPAHCTLGQGEMTYWFRDRRPPSAYALAQHHGVPTRLLDWTSDWRAACCFAAMHAGRGDSPEFGVFAVRRRYLKRAGLSIFRCPRAHSQYLHAQSGWFSYSPGGLHLADDDGPSIRQQLAQVEEEDQLLSIVAPNRVSNAVLRMLEKEGVSKGQLMPTLDNVVEDLKLGPWAWLRRD